jgi:subtilisin family serine protease
MPRSLIRLIIPVILVSIVYFAGRSPAHSDSASLPGSEKRRSNTVFDKTYRSRTSSHKVIVFNDEPALRESVLNSGGELLEDYGSYSLLRAPADAAEQVNLHATSGSSVRDDMNMILLRARRFDTTEGEPFSVNSLGSVEVAHKQLYLVQMIGPIKSEWRSALESDDIEVIGYVPNNAYLVRATSKGFNQIQSRKSVERSFIQWAAEFKPAYKVAPEINLDANEEILAAIELISDGSANQAVDELLRQTSAARIGTPITVDRVTDVRLRIHTSQIPELARRANVLWIEPWAAPELLDEKQNQIVAGNYSGNTVSPPNYLQWLQSKGLGTSPSFIVDIADGGIDQGILDPQVIHQDFLNPAGVNRVQYARAISSGDLVFSTEDTGGHGTLNASIVGGYNVGTGFPFVDGDGYHFGLGVHPFARLGVTRIFAPDYTNPDLTLMVASMFANGSRVSSNSWGAYNNSYNIDCRLYDTFVRDAQAAVSGRQEMNIVFSVGNRGPGQNLSVPGHAKNVICVGASEGLRPGTDGCHIDDSGADTINSVAAFSSGGPSDDGRVKPDIITAGSHIQGAQSQSFGYTGSAICGPIDVPAGQTLYTWSSGTSHSAPAVAGAAALVRQFVEQSTGQAASPAMVKALLLNTTTYVSGDGGGDNLPGNQQGWGLLNLGMALDSAPRMRVDQSVVFNASGDDFTVSGGVANAAAPLRVTLVWTDAPGNPPALGPSVNDLDLRVEFGGKTYLGNQFSGDVSIEGGTGDRKNNVESVWLPAGASGNFTVRVTAFNLVGDGVPGSGPSTDQDFALVIYNAQALPGGGGDPLDAPPSVALSFPVGGENIRVGDVMRIRWDASDDKGLESQKVEFSADGTNFATIGLLNGAARFFDWRVPAIPTTSGKIRVTALDGVNLPVSSVNQSPFTVEQGPPDLAPPTVLLQAPRGDAIVGGGQVVSIRWRESDNVGVIRRVLEFSTNNGNSFQPIADLLAPSSGEDQTFDWQVPAEMSTQKGKVRITVFDGSENSASVSSNGKFEVWPMPVITAVEYHFGVDGGKDELEVSGRNLRTKDTKILVDGKQLAKIKFLPRWDIGDGFSRKVFSVDKKLAKRIPGKTLVEIQVLIGTTDQLSAGFGFKRARNP